MQITKSKFRLSNYTEEQFIKLVNESNSLAELARKLGVNERNSFYKHLGLYIKENEINVNHFKSYQKITAKDLRKDKYYNGDILLKILLDELQWNYECSVCGITEWNDKEIKLQIDHIDGNSSNSLPSNLRFLCPNCHSQTETFMGKNKPKRPRIPDEEFIKALQISTNIREALTSLGLTPRGSNYSRAYELAASNNIKLTKYNYDLTTPVVTEIEEVFSLEEPINLRGPANLCLKRKCIDCGILLKSKDGIRCSVCSHKQLERIEWPLPEIMQELLWQEPTNSIAKRLGVSDVAIAKYAKKHNLTKPSRGYWAKKYAEAKSAAATELRHIP